MNDIIALIAKIDIRFILYAIFLINAWAFMMFGWDKICAENGRWRVAESTLLGIAFVGGLLGAYLGRMVFRHKTRKQEFSDHLFMIAVLHFGIATFCTIYIIL